MPIEMKCENCGNPFYCYQSEIDKGRKYCSLTCRSAHRFKKDLLPASRTPVDFTCKECGKPFIMMQSYLTAYRKKFGRDPMFCSTDCSYANYRKRTEAEHIFTCLACGKENHNRRKPGGRLYREQKFCDQKCKAEYQRMQFHARFSDGTHTRRMKRGYVLLRVPTQAGEPRREILEHRFVMQQFLGRDLFPGETVHHKSGDKTDNRIDNLQLFVKNHGPGQEVHDVIRWCVRMFETYPQIAAQEGYVLTHVKH